MRHFLALAALSVLVGCAAKTPPSSITTSPDQCRLTRDDLIANRSLSWSEFDQRQNSRTSWSALGSAGCHDAAAIAYADYLAFGPPIAGERYQTTARFHLGRSLAYAGRTEEAARIIATARRETEVGGLHWNDYVQGTVAFLTRDRETLAARQASLATQSGFADRMNAGVLAGLLHCWDRPYLEAAALACTTASGYQMPAE
ncbi:hypothetical protein L7H23_02675 [Sphingopyxis sp. BSN-002]|uniref:hypothetical protein n=1 Tax=Sphingopyxis sp. BSN-002 TaxID=2911495 RepID=UPI001EDB01F9|nr:hypothetical protein [Sphingopyxis sp. BSN-002]UKK85030.1 hypothetical protein L7H23_02675 [Sphingopyxis sp. BSN-002]